MKKILVIFNNFHLPKQVLDAAVHIAKREKASLFGLFVQSLKPEDTESYPFPSDINLTDTDFTEETDEQESLRLEDAQAKFLEDVCVAEGVPFYMHRIHKNYLDSLIDHSAFADLMICDAEKNPTQYSIKSLLADAYCPVLLIPENYRNFEKVIFTYDGNSSSMHAIRMFTYLFSFARNFPVYLVSVLPHNIREIEYRELIQEWLPLHYPNSEIEILKGDVKEELPLFISQHKDALIIMGAYGRSALSRIFKESLAQVILEKTNAPVFITHD